MGSVADTAREPLRVDPERFKAWHGYTGVYVRAELDGSWDAFDIAELDTRSLRQFLRQNGGDNTWAEATVAMILRHDSSAIDAAWGFDQAGPAQVRP